MQKMQVKKTIENAIMPTQAHRGDAGWDLYSPSDIIIEPNKTEKIDIGIAIALPENTFGAIYARSGLATKYGLRPANCVGVVDCGYRGNIVVALHNDSGDWCRIYKGDRIAQLIVQPYIPVDIEETEILDETERGDGGFGSSGK